MTSKNSFWKLSNWNFRKRSWAFALCAVIWFFILPVTVFIQAGSMTQAYTAVQLEQNIDWIRYSIINSSISGSGAYSILVIGMGILLGLQGFSWTNHQNKVDLFKSVPVKSSTRFWYINLNSLWIFVLSFGGNMLLANAAAGIQGVWNNAFFIASVVSFFMHLLLFIAVYFLVLIAQSLTGNVVLGFFGASVLLLIEPLCFLLRRGLMGTFYQTYVEEGFYETFEKGIFSPISAYVGMYKSISMKTQGFADSGSYGDIGKYIVLFLIQSVVYGIIAYILYQKRTAQTGGKNMIFPKTKPVIKCVIMIVGSLLFGVFMAGFNYDTPIWYGLFGVICGLLILQAVVQTIMEGDFKEAVRGRVSFVAAALISVAVYFVFALDMTGYDTYLPEAGQVESFAFCRYSDYCYNYTDENGNYISARDYLMDNMKITDEEAKEQIIALLQQAIDSGAYSYRDDDIIADSIYEDGNQREVVDVKFRLSGGREVVRQYYIRVDLVRGCWARLYELTEYKEAVYMILRDYTEQEFFNSERILTVYYSTYDIGNSNDYNIESSYEMVKALYGAMKSDILKRDSQMILSQAPIGLLHFYSGNESGYNQVVSFQMPVYADDEETLAILKEAGWYQEPGVREEDIAVITVYQAGDPDNEGDAKAVYKEIVDKQLEIKPGDPLFSQVAADLVIYETTDYTSDSGAFTKADYSAVVTMKDGRRGSCLLRIDKFPEELEKAFEDVEIETE